MAAMIGTKDSASIGMTLPFRFLKNLASIVGSLARWDSGRFEPNCGGKVLSFRAVKDESFSQIRCKLSVIVL
jgi:hypothetical protein